MQHINDFIRSEYNELRTVFTPKEAWWLFKTMAFAETAGWTLLILGIVSKKTKFPANEFILPIAGSIHGVFFITYVMITFFVHRSLGWSIKKLIVAEIAANIPFAALIFEQIVKPTR